MITVSTGESEEHGETPRMWFDRAVAAQFDYEPAYDTLLWSLMPRWGGSHEQMYLFGLECLDTGRFDTFVPGRFLDALATIKRRDHQDYWELPQTYKHCKAYFEGRINQPVFGDDKWHKSLYAATAWHCGHYDDARKIMDEMGDNLKKTAFSSFYSTNFGQAKDMVYAFTGPCRDHVSEAEKLYKAWDLAKALQLYKMIAVDTKTDTPTVSYAKERLAVLSMEEGFHRDEWVDLSPDRGFNGWHPYGNGWSVESDGSVKLTYSKRAYLLCDADFGDDYEFKGEMEVVTSPGKQAAIGGLLTDSIDAVYFLSVLMEISGSSVNRVSISKNFNSKEKKSMEITGEGSKYTFLLHKMDGKVTFYLNDKKVFDKIGIYDDLDMEHYRCKKSIGLCIYSASPGTVIRYKGLHVKRLT